jgi:hypothetical protein
MPPITQTADGATRRIGVEIELSGLSIDEAADVVSAHCGGAVELERPGRYEIEVLGDLAGPWQVELDFSALKTLGRMERDDGLASQVQELAEDVLRAVAERIVPVEVVSPPLPLERLGEVERLIAALRVAGARGTGDEPVYAFGMQLNPELPATDVDTIRGYLQAFLCLEDWLRRRARVDLTRRLALFAEPFPKDYARKVVDTDYVPHRDRLIDDYLAANPTRNRSLDLLPLFTYLDAPRVRAVVDDVRVKPRPTLHYRLPNSEIDQPDWGLHGPWRDWLVVERIAADPVALADLCARYAEFLSHPLERLTGDWAEPTDQWLAAHQLH